MRSPLIKAKMANSLELASTGRDGGESDGGQESGQPQGHTHLTAQAHRHGKTARRAGGGWRLTTTGRTAAAEQGSGRVSCPPFATATDPIRANP